MVNVILKNVKAAYSAIAHEFDVTRDKPWPEFEIFLAELKKRYKLQTIEASINYKLLDMGCGNGRLSHFLKKEPINYTGVDNNHAMLRIAKKKNPKAHFRYAEAQKLPFPPKYFDAVWAIALLHHLPTQKLQLGALEEMKRVLKPGGLLCLMVWNLWQKKYKKYIDAKTRHAHIPWGGKVAPSPSGRAGRINDELRSASLRLGLQDKKILRYYYAFRASELHDLLKKSGFHSVKKLRSEHNLAFICNS